MFALLLAISSRGFAQTSTNFSDVVPPKLNTNGLVGWWHLNTNALDSSGKGHHGNIVGATPVPGRFNLAYHFDGNSFIDVGDIDITTTQQFTVSTWLRTTNSFVTNEARMWISKLDPAGGGILELYTGGTNSTPGGAYSEWNGNTNIFTLSTTNQDVRDGDWHNITFTFKQGSQVLYFDGMPIQKSASTNVIIANIAPIRIGGMNFGTNHFMWQGDIDEVAIWNRNLGAAEVRSNALGPKLSISPASSVIISVQQYELAFIEENILHTNQLATKALIKVDNVDVTTNMYVGATNGFLSNGVYIISGFQPVFSNGTHKISATFTLQNGDVISNSVSHRVLQAIP